MQAKEPATGNCASPVFRRQPTPASASVRHGARRARRTLAWPGRPELAMADFRKCTRKRADRCTPGARAPPVARRNGSLAATQGRTLMTQELFDRCIAACNACATACGRCAAACLREPDVKSMAACIALDTDCEAMCRLCASLMARGSVHARAACRLCAEVCRACGDECASHDHDHCQACATACRSCAQECRNMAASAP